MDFKNYLNNTSNSLDQEIDQILSDFLHQVEKINSKLVPFALGLISSCKGGKRIRGTLVKLGYEIANSEFRIQNSELNDEIIKVGAALEILHTAILIHDDIIDQSQLRRGKLTLYKALGGDHYGISQALSLGDIGLYLPIKLIADSNFQPIFKNQAISYLAQTIINTGWGEVLDVEIPHLSGKRLEEDVIAIHTLKTAHYTTSGPLILGAILAGAKSDLAGGDEELLGILEKFGENLGIAFQIQDDILGVFGEEKELGKSTTSDIEEGKNTLLLTESLKRANNDQKNILDKYYGKGKVGKVGFEKVKAVFKECGALDYSYQLALQYITQAKKVIPQITKDQSMRRLLEEMAEFLVERSK